MHILICSFLFDKDAEGICTGRLVRSLLGCGIKITVVTSESSDTTLHHPNLNFIRISSFPWRARRTFNIMARILGHIPTSYYIWCRRVAALSLPDTPQLIYGRSQPFCSIVAAHALSKRTHIPLVTHLSDPIPSPWVEENSRAFSRTVKYMERIIQSSKAVTFITSQALSYQELKMSVPIKDKAFVLNHIAPEPALLPVKTGVKSKNFLYLGNFYGNRMANYLLQGFSLHLRTSVDSQMSFVGTDPNMILPEANRLGITDSVKIFPGAKDVRPYMEEADVLVAVDASVGEPVFLTTKLIEYLVVNRPILLSSPLNSPGSQLVKKFERTVVRVDCQDTHDICNGMNMILEMQADKNDYLKRFDIMEVFNGTKVATYFVEELLRRGLIRR